MTSQEPQLVYSSFEEFMTEDKLPPVFPSSQSSNVSETPACSQHLISEVCDRDIYGPFGIGLDDDLPSNFVNSSLAYSPNSLPPRSPSDDSSLCNISSDNSSTFDPTDETPTLIEDTMETSDELSDDVVVSDLPVLDKDELMKYLDNFAFDAINEDFDNFPHEESQTSNSQVIYETPTILNIKREDNSSNNSSIAPNENSEFTHSCTSQNDETKSSSLSPVSSKSKKTSTRGRKRKLFSNGDEKKKIQNKDAARRYREKKKQKDAELEAEAEELIVEQTKLRKELAEITRLHSEFVGLYAQIFQSKRKKD